MLAIAPIFFRGAAFAKARERKRPMRVYASWCVKKFSN
jgi:hypothetical protein